MAQKNSTISKNALQGSLIASGVMYLRVLILILIISPSIVIYIGWQLILLSLIGFGLSFYKLKIHSGKSYFNKEPQNLQNPFEIRPALMFAVLFVVLSVITGWVKMYFGKSGVLTLSAVVGITDIDPFILSLISSSNFGINILISAILIAMMSNTIMKGIYFSYLSADARKESIYRFGFLTFSHIPLILITLL